MLSAPNNKPKSFRRKNFSLKPRPSVGHNSEHLKNENINEAVVTTKVTVGECSV
jgi:hypothetical protein